MTPDVTPVPVTESSDELLRGFATMFAACSMTWSRYKKDQKDVDLIGSFLCGNEDVSQPARVTDTCVAPKLEDLTS